MAVGVDAICAEAGVSKRSMYKLFENKAALFAASLESQIEGYMSALLPPDNDDRSPRE